ncbi:uncharacterized protein K489DRAFT_29369 [Dissoconium aciculare CBS 342.82]|uniref:Uncharacterized protein n=1 Tax=Dissoconium aciculare CBS 342.82 TaxID=1314786 RepID=A0A6J3MIV8_9PEZI|nr:uncharacterized protein K489DRAFT_29369 [Dissoconium aciculare CBS 342.82]KAF1827840.1 hypothetical protein K489DRAFT_29369 [Dissoconium aciculare CBS 342.82]
MKRAKLSRTSIGNSKISNGNERGSTLTPKGSLNGSSQSSKDSKDSKKSQRKSSISSSTKSKRRQSISDSLKSVYRGRTSHAHDCRGLAVSDMELSHVNTPAAGSTGSIAMVMTPSTLSQPAHQPLPQPFVEQLSPQDVPISQPQEAHSFDASKSKRKKETLRIRLTRWLTVAKTRHPRETQR